MNIFLKILLAVVASSLIACSEPPSRLRIGTNVWPGYEPFYLAREKGIYKDKNIRLVEMPSSSDVMSAMRLGLLEGGALTLDEVLVLASEGHELSIVLVCDQSDGADVAIARPEITDLKDLAGRTIAAETSAVGALMLHSLLSAADLSTSEVNIRHLNLVEHQEAFKKGEIDAAISFAPHRYALEQAGGQVIFSSRDIPGQIVDVLAVFTSTLDTHPNALRSLVFGYLAARQMILEGDLQTLEIINRRMRLSEADLLKVYDGLNLPDDEYNRMLLEGSPSPLTQQAALLESLMVNNHLLQSRSPHPLMTTARFLPEGL